jgi:hypothetical protein
MTRTQVTGAGVSANGGSGGVSNRAFEGGTMAIQSLSAAVTREAMLQPSHRAKPPAGPDVQRRRRGLGVLMLGALLGTACGVTNEGALPPDVQDPSTIRTESGALNYYRGVLTSKLPRVLEHVIYPIAILTDEFIGLPTAVGQIGSFGQVTFFDSRVDLTLFTAVPTDSDPYGLLHRLRSEARQARGFLGAYAPDLSPALRGHMFAMEAYAEIFLADLFCSGIPLSTVDFEADYTLTRGFSTAEVYNHAAELFDSAVALSGDSSDFQDLAAVGKGRALLGQGLFAAAAAAVAAVPDNFVYQVTPPPEDRYLHGLRYTGTVNDLNIGLPSMANLEGINGLPYRSSGDPRTAADSMPTWNGTDSVPKKDARGNSVYLPNKYTPTNGSFTYLLASGIEARLIEAEAVLQAGSGEWLTKINHLRQTAWPSIVPATPGPLPDLVDPGPDVDGDDDLRVNLLFRERAFWLFVTGHRQGDMRRLIRPPYNRLPNQVYPTGSYQGGLGSYGQEIVVPVPDDEQVPNPNYTGCIHRNA